jgi:hypothetical protein
MITIMDYSKENEWMYSEVRVVSADILLIIVYTLG